MEVATANLKKSQIQGNLVLVKITLFFPNCAGFCPTLHSFLWRFNVSKCQTSGKTRRFLKLFFLQKNLATHGKNK